MAGKKPVWVDEDAHAILKIYAKLTKSSMVDVASKLVLRRLPELSPEAGLEAPAEPAAPAVGAKAEPVHSKPVAVNPRKPAKKRRPAKVQPDPNDTNVRYLGGIWLV